MNFKLRFRLAIALGFVVVVPLRPALGADNPPAGANPQTQLAPAHPPSYVKKKAAVVPSDQQIDINAADKAVLKTLPGITDAEAGKIVAGRPYGSKTDLVFRNILPEGKYQAIKYRILAGPVPKATPKK